MKKDETTFLGVDPGRGGGAAWLVFSANKIVRTDWLTFVDTESFIASYFDDDERHDVTYCVIEKVHSMPKQGVKSSFTFGYYAGFVRGIVCAHSIPFQEVLPRKWQKGLGLRAKIKGEAKSQWKRHLLQQAQNLLPAFEWPDTRKHQLAVADAVLMAEYARRVYVGETY